MFGPSAILSRAPCALSSRFWRLLLVTTTARSSAYAIVETPAGQSASRSGSNTRFHSVGPSIDLWGHLFVGTFCVVMLSCVKRTFHSVG
jgi:hypothetical protein